MCRNGRFLSGQSLRIKEISALNWQAIIRKRFREWLVGISFVSRLRCLLLNFVSIYLPNASVSFSVFISLLLVN